MPPSSPQAKIRFKTNTGEVAHLYFIDVSSCPAPATTHLVGRIMENWLFGDIKEASSVSMIGSTDKEETRVRERVIRADQPLIFSIWGFRPAVVGTPGYSCQLHGMFRPQPGAQYEISWLVTHSPLQCRGVIERLTLGKPPEVVRIPEPSARRLSKQDLENACALR